MSDILGGQGVDPDLLAEIYDLEHEAVTADAAFYSSMVAEVAGRGGATVLDLGCGSGRLFRAFADGGAREVVGVDASAALLRRAAARIAADERLAAMRREGRLRVELGDARDYASRRRFSLVIAAGLVPHLDGPAEADRLLRRVAGLLRRGGRLVIEQLGPGALPTRDLPLSVDWRRTLPDGRRMIRRSALKYHPAPNGVRVEFSTFSDVEYPNGTIARLPARFRLWYPSPDALIRLVEGAGLVVEATFGSHTRRPLEAASEHCILVGRRGEWQASRSAFW